MPLPDLDSLLAAAGAVTITRDAFSMTIGFRHSAAAADSNCITCDRDHLLNLIAAPACSVVIFDLTGIDDPPGGLVELLVWAKEHDRDVELFNPSPGVQEMLRVANLDTFLLMRGATS
jgi:hypothetical protein